MNTQEQIVISFCCPKCNEINDFSFEIERKGKYNKIYKIYTQEPCSHCGVPANMECVLNGHTSTGHWLETDPFVDFNPTEWENTPEEKPDRWAMAIAAGYPINQFGFGGQIRQTKRTRQEIDEQESLFYE